MKVTFATDDPELYQAIKVEAAARKRTIRDIVEEALREWLERREEAADRESAAAALEEYSRERSVPAAGYFVHLAAELRETYPARRA